jgi:hydrogenase-4 transcriptional activator
MPDTTEKESPGILVVEDEALVARDIQSRLQQLGHRVVGLAHNPKQAFKLAEELQPNLLLCDIHLKHEIDGIDVAAAITERMDIPVVFLTAYSDKETVAKAKAVTPYGYVLKPIETPDLQIAIEMALHKFSLEQELRDTRQLLATALQAIGDVLVFVDTEGKISNINDEAEILFGAKDRQVAGDDWHQLFGLERDAGEHSIQRLLQRALSSETVTRMPPFSVVKADGCHVLLDGIVGPTSKKGVSTGVVLILRELAEIHDPVESLPRDEERAFVLMLVNPDNFDELAQTLAADDRDALLLEISAQLNRSMRASDLATHYGGAIFSASLPHTSLDQASSIAEAILQSLSEYRYLQGRVNLSFSIGMAHYRPGVGGAGEESPLELFRRANWALNLARQGGGGRVAVWRPGTDIDIIGSHDRQSGLLAADSGRDYRNMVLLWNTINSVAKSKGVLDLADKLVIHFHKSFDLEMAAIFLPGEQGARPIASSPPSLHEQRSELDLAQEQLQLIDSAITGDNLDADGIAHEGNAHCIPLRQDGACRGALYVVSNGAQAGLRQKDLAFMKTMVDYVAGPLVQQLSEPQAIVEAVTVDPESDLLYQSEAMAGVMEHIRLVAPTDATVLITGESGTGKELISREIHRLSDRRDQPFVIVDCGAMVGSLIESELFGHTKGAFTGAGSATTGKIKEADGGTILLDEIGELAIDVQAKLLRLVQEKQFTAVGSNQYQTVDTRIIAATNVDLEASIANGSFREDLYYRLNVFTVHSPPLRERAEDIPGLASHFLRSCSQQYKKNIKGFTAPALEGLQHYHWPGNIRELRNKLIRAVILCQDQWIDLPQLDLHGPADLHTVSALPLAAPVTIEAGIATEPLDIEELEAALALAFEQQVRRCLSEGVLPPLGGWLEEDLINASLQLHQQVNTRAAEALGLPESTLRRKVARYGANGQSVRGADWQAVSGQLSRWIAIAGEKHINPMERLQQLLLRQISLQSRNQTEAATLTGVSTPTYRRQLSRLE